MKDYRALDLIFVFIIAAMAALLIPGCASSVPEYQAGQLPATYVRFEFEGANVRSEPGVLSQDAGNNIIGTLREGGFTIELASGEAFVQTDLYNVANGNFYGFYVEDILATPEGRAWFPSEGKLSEDSDDIVWINEEYVEIVCYSTPS